MARPLALPFDWAAASGTQPVTNLSDDFNALKNGVNDSAIGYNNYTLDTGTANTVVLTLTSAPLAYTPGMTVTFVVLADNSGASTINVNGLGAVPLNNKAAAPLLQGNLIAGNSYLAVYHATGFRVLNTDPPILTMTAGGSANVSGNDSAFIFCNLTATGGLTLTGAHNGFTFDFYVGNIGGAPFSFNIGGAAPFSGQWIYAFTSATAVPTVQTAVNTLATPLLVPVGRHAIGRASCYANLTLGTCMIA